MSDSTRRVVQKTAFYGGSRLTKPRYEHLVRRVHPASDIHRVAFGRHQHALSIEEDDVWRLLDSIPIGPPNWLQPKLADDEGAAAIVGSQVSFQEGSQTRLGTWKQGAPGYRNDGAGAGQTHHPCLHDGSM